MADAQMKNAPRLEGWVIGGGVGLVGFGVIMALGDLGYVSAIFIGGVLALVVGLILGLPAPEAAAPVKAAVAPVVKAPVAPAAAAPVALTPVTAAPVAAAPMVVAPVAEAHAPVAASEATRPAALTAARGGKADDLKQIKGVGPKMETLLNSLGFYHFDQIAAWSAAEVAWVDANLEGFKGRVTRDDWVAQAKTLAAGGETAFSKRVEDGEVY